MIVIFHEWRTLPILALGIALAVFVNFLTAGIIGNVYAWWTIAAYSLGIGMLFENISNERLRSPNKLFWIPLKYWAGIFFVFGIINFWW